MGVIKKCKGCGKYFTAYDTIRKLCGECLIKNTNQKPLKTYLKNKSLKNKNTVAKFSLEVKWKIKERDEYCIICGQEGCDFHHVYFSQEAEYGEDRNNEDKGVLLCRLCHGKAHGCKRGEGIRQECILYLKNIYG